MILLLSFFAFALPLVFADVEFTSPSAGADIPVGTINVSWKDSGRAPPITDLTVFTLQLYVGGDEEDNMLEIATFESNGNFNTNTAQGTIGAGIAGSVPNGFFFRMTSATSSGGNLINFSNRFSITGLTGTTDEKYRNAVEALNGNTNPPPREGNIPALSSSSSASAQPTATNARQTVTVTTGKPDPTSGVPVADSSNGSGPGAGVIAGAVIACIAFLIAAIGIGIWMSMRRKKRRNNAPHPDDDDDEVWGKQISHSETSLSELSAEGKVVEMGDGIAPSEMDSNSIRVELEGDCEYESSKTFWTPVGTLCPLTPVAPSISEETLGSPTSVRSQL